MRTYTLVDAYRFYKANGGTLSKSEYKNICQDFNIGIMNFIIYEAGVFNMGSHLSTIHIMRHRRNYSNPQIDWKASNEYKEELLAKGEKLYDKETGEGTKWLIYHDEEWYFRFHWKKKYAKFKNKSAYRFIATRGVKGNKTKLKEHLAEDELNYLKYEDATVR